MGGQGGRPPPIDQNLGLALAARLRHGGKFSLKSLTFGHFLCEKMYKKLSASGGLAPLSPHQPLTIVTSALEVFLNVMRYINPRFTYLLTSHLAHIGEISNGHISTRGRPIHLMFGSTVGFSRSADRMALFRVGPNSIGMWKKTMREE